MFAKFTTIPVEKSIEDLRGALVKFGARNFSFGNNEDKAFVAFDYDGYKVRIEFHVEKYPGVKPTQVQLRKYEQKRKCKWRELGLFVKVKFQSVLSGFETFPQAFMPHIILKDGQLLGEKVLNEVKNLRHPAKAISIAPKSPKLKAS